MSRTQAQILELFRALPAAEQIEFVLRLSEEAVSPSFYDRMTPDQRAELEEAIAEADRGEGETASEVFRQLAEKYGFDQAK